MKKVEGGYYRAVGRKGRSRAKGVKKQRDHDLLSVGIVS